VAAEAYAVGAVMGNDISGFADPGYLGAAAAAGAAVVATHIRLRPRVPDPQPVYEDVVEEVGGFLLARARQAEEAGVAPERIVLDAGLDLGKTATQSLRLLRASDRLAALGYPLLLSASNKTFLGKVLDLDIDARREASLAATAIGVGLGCRIVRVHEVGAHRQACRVLAAISEASTREPLRPAR
jgi:dihydropteroate synthase